MSSALEIIRAWHIYTKGEPQTRRLIEQRMKICETCPEMMALSHTGQLLLNLIVEGVSFKCAKCKCALEVKCSDPEHHCPLGKW
jgi:hypothetical protein